MEPKEQRLKKAVGEGRKNAGFTLVEIMVAMVILSMVFLPVIHSFIRSLRYTENSKKIQSAGLAAQSVMEEVKAGASLEKVKEAYAAQAAAGKAGFKTEVNPATGVITFGRPMEIDGRSYYVTTEAEPVKTYTNAELETMDSQRDIIALESRLMEMNAILRFMSMNSQACEDYLLTDLADATKEEQDAWLAANKITSEEFYQNRLKREIHADFSVNGEKVLVKIYYRYYFTESIQGVAGIHEANPSYADEVLEETTVQHLVLEKNNIWFFYSGRPKDGQEEAVIVHAEGGSSRLAKRMYFVCQNREEMEEAYRDYHILLRDKNGNFLSTFFGDLAEGISANIEVRGWPDSEIEEIVTETANFSRMANLTVRVYENETKYNGGEEPLFTLEGVFGGGVQ